MRPLNPGWSWTGKCFEFVQADKDADEEQCVTGVQRTTREVTKAMCAMVDFLKFTGEDCSMFTDQTLPTLDTSLWIEGRQVKYKFFEKPTVGNQVLNRNTALPVASLRSSLLQETIRRLQNCSLDLDLGAKQEILSTYGLKLINSGHSIKSARILLVQGVVKYLWKLKLSQLPCDDPMYSPMFLDKNYCEETRQIDKYQARAGWFRKEKSKNDPTDGAVNDNWRRDLKGIWRGSDIVQKPVLDNGFSTVLNVPNTSGAKLAVGLMRCEERLAKLTKYNVKIIEKSGVQLCRLFQRVFSPDRCHWDKCPVCLHSDAKGNSRCRAANVVYEAKCIECLEWLENGEIEAGEVGVYVGETSRTLVERAMEHVVLGISQPNT